MIKVKPIVDTAIVKSFDMAEPSLVAFMWIPIPDAARCPGPIGNVPDRLSEQTGGFLQPELDSGAGRLGKAMPHQGKGLADFSQVAERSLNAIDHLTAWLGLPPTST